MNGAVTIDGYSEPGSSPNTSATASNAVLMIELTGTALTTGAGLHLLASPAVVRGLAINRFPASQILLFGTSGHRIEGNFLGTTVDGTADPGGTTGGQGVFISSGDNHVIGGTMPDTRNVISGNDLDGVTITGTTPDSNDVLGNLIGIDKTGTVAVGNGLNGVSIDQGANVVGGTTAAARNVISGNGEEGVRISHGRGE